MAKESPRVRGWLMTLTYEDMSSMPSFWLEYDNNGQIQEFNFDGDSVSVGRDKSSDFVLDHPTVSRQHAVVASKNGGFYLVVLSRGGMTAINGQQVQGEVMLHDGSMVHLGQLKFRFRSNHATAKPAGGHQQMASGQFGGSQSGQFGNSHTGQSQSANQSGGFSQPNASGFGAGGAQNVPNAQNPQDSGGYGFGELPSSGSSPTNSLGAGAAESSAEPQAQQSRQQPGGEPASGDQAPEDNKDSGIISWDEIASSSEATDGDAEAGAQGPLQKKKKDEETNPMLVIVAGAAIVGLMWFTFFGDGPAGVNTKDDSSPLEDQSPMALEVSCMGESACLQQAKESYKVGSEKLEKKGAAISNLFEGYKKLLETELYLEKAGKKEPLAEMADFEAKKSAARDELTSIFKNERVKYHQAKKRSQHIPMAQSLDAVKVYFPDKTAREHRWALNEEMEMKRKGIYPKHVYPKR
jgi:hypothetical protein